MMVFKVSFTLKFYDSKGLGQGYYRAQPGKAETVVGSSEGEVVLRRRQQSPQECAVRTGQANCS